MLVACGRSIEKGRFLSASRDILAGETVLVDGEPLIWWFSDSSSSSGVEDDGGCALSRRLWVEWSALIDDPLLISTVMAYRKLVLTGAGLIDSLDDFMHCEPSCAADLVDKFALICSSPGWPLFADPLVAHHVKGDVGQAVLRFVLICFSNAHFVPVELAEGDGCRRVDLCGLFPMASQMNHSCAPNTIFYCDTKSTDDMPPRLVFKAIRDIGAGDEVSCCYMNELQTAMPFEFRRREIMRTKYFHCRCRRCRLEIDYLLDSDHLWVFESSGPLEGSGILSALDAGAKGDSRVSLWCLMRLATTFSMMCDSLPSAAVAFSGLADMSVLSSWLFYCCLVDNLAEHNAALVARWVALGCAATKHIPMWHEWLRILPTQPPSEIELVSTTEWMANLKLMFLDSSWLRSNPLPIDSFTAHLAHKVWKCIALGSKLGILPVKELREDLEYFNVLRKKYRRLTSAGGTD